MMAILVHPRRWVVLGVAAFLLITLGLPCLAQQYLTSANRSAAVQGVPDTLFVVLGVGVGAFLAGVYGGMSRRIAQRRKTETLSVFFGGVLGAACFMMLAGCLIQIPLMLFFGPTPVKGEGVKKFLIIGALCLFMFSGSLVGFWLGGMFIARFIQRRLILR